MPEPFSLARQPWIPVATRTGRKVLVRPCEIITPIDGDPILRIDTGRPDCDISMTEFLIGLLAVSMGPEGQRDWLSRYRTPPTSAEFELALQPFEHAFNLDGDGPRFFQDLETFEGAEGPTRQKRIEQLFSDSPGEKTVEENADHFVKRARVVTLSRAGAAIALLTLQTIAPSGGSGLRTSLRGGGPLTTIIIPGTRTEFEPTLWEKLWANVPAHLVARGSEASRIFPWLTDTRSSDPRNGGATTTPEDVHPAQVFFGMPRRIRLVFETNTQKIPCDLLGNTDPITSSRYIEQKHGTQYASWERSHPLTPYRKSKPSEPQFLAVQLRSSRVGYRQWLGLVAAIDRLRLPARTVTDFGRRAEDLGPQERRAVRLLVGGYAFKPGQATALDFAEAMLPLIVTGDESCDEAVADLARRFINSAESIANQLSNSVKRALYGERGNAKRDSSVLEPVRTRFWADTEDAFYGVLGSGAESIETNKSVLREKADELIGASGKAWLAELKRHALRIYDETVPVDDAKSERLEDVIKGRTRLVWALTGYGPIGESVFDELRQPHVQISAKHRKGGQKK